MRSSTMLGPLLRSGALLAALAIASCRPSKTPAGAEPDPDTIPDAFARPSGALMWPGAHRAFEVTPAGDLTNGVWVVRIGLETEGAAAAPPRRIAAEERWLPVLHWMRHAGALAWRCRATVIPPERDADSSLTVSLLIETRNTATHPVRCAARLLLTPPDEPADFVAPDAESTETSALAWGRGGSARPVHAWCARAGRGAELRAQRVLAPGERFELRAVLPAYAAPEAALRRWGRTPQGTLEGRARDAWRRETSRALRLELSDPEVERAYRAGLVVLLSCRERTSRGWLPIGNPFQYRDVWLRDGARLAAALATTGYTREARDLAAGLLELQWPQGAFVSQRGQLDGTGQALWAFEQTMLRPSPDPDVPRYARAASRALQWAEAQRELGRAAAWAYGTLMPCGDPRDNEAVCAQLVGNDAWTLAGYGAAARLLRAADRRQEAARADSARERYLADVRRALASRADLPPSWQDRGRDWGNLSAVYPCGLLRPDDPRARRTAERAWRESGEVGVCAYGARDSLHGYLAADLGVWAMLADDPATADRVLEALLAWRNACGAGAELFSRSSRDYGRNLPPHASSAAALVTLLRNALVFDDRDTLQLTLGARPRWWRGATASGAPTRWGVIDLSFRRDAEAAAWRWTPVPVWTRLRLPPGCRLRGSVPTPLQAAADGRSVLAPPGTHEATVALRTESP